MCVYDGLTTLAPLYFKPFSDTVPLFWYWTPWVIPPGVDTLPGANLVVGPQALAPGGPVSEAGLVLS